MAGSPRNAAVGVTFTATSPLFFGSTDAVVGATVGGVNNATLTASGGLGDSLTIPGTLTSGAYDWSQLPNWQYVDDRVAHMRAEGTPVKMLTVYSAPLFMLNNPNGDSRTTILSGLANYPVANSWFNAFGDLVHYIVNRYLGFGVMYYCLWVDGNGFVSSGRLGYETYTQMFNAAWTAVKGDLYTKQAQLGGPGFKMAVRQNGYTYGSSINAPLCQSALTPGTPGSWGEVDPNVTDGLWYFSKNATGYDFIVASVDPSDTSGGGPNPNGLSFSDRAQYFQDAAGWLTTNVNNNPSGKTVPVLTKCTAGFDFTTINQVVTEAGYGGSDMFMFSGAGTVVDGKGALADCGPSVNAYTAANPPNSLLAPPKAITAPTYYPPFTPAPGSVTVITPATPSVRTTGTGSLNVTTTAPNTFTASLDAPSQVNNDIILICSQFSGSGADFQYFTSTGFSEVTKITNVAMVPTLSVMRYAGAPVGQTYSIVEKSNGGGGGWVGAGLLECAKVDSSVAAQVLYSGYTASQVPNFQITGASAPNQSGQLWIMAVALQNYQTLQTTTCTTPSGGWLPGPSYAGGNRGTLFTYYMVGGASAPANTMIGGFSNNQEVAVIIIGLKPSAS